MYPLSSIAKLVDFCTMCFPLARISSREVVSSKSGHVPFGNCFFAVQRLYFAYLSAANQAVFFKETFNYENT